MAEKIGYQSGILAAMNVLRKAFPANAAAFDKLQRTLTLLANEYDARQTPDPLPDDPPPPPPAKRLAPQTYNRGSRGQDAKYCVNAPGVIRRGDGRYVDEAGYVYDDQGLCMGGRSGNPVEGLKPSDMMDDKQPCDGYEWMGRVFPPWPAGSYEV